jgi:hypothetical protein
MVKMSPAAKENFASQMTQEQINELEGIAQGATLTQIFKMIGAFMKSQNAIKGAILPQLPLELAIAEIKLSEGGELTPAGKTDYNAKAGQGSGQAPVPPREEKKKEEELAVPDASPAPAASPSALPSPAPSPESEEAPAEMETSEERAGDIAAVFERVKDDWGDIVADTRKSNGSLVACLKTCQPILAEGSAILVACQYPFYKDKLQKPENRVAVEQVASETVKAQVHLRFITREEAQARGFEMEEITVESKQAEDMMATALDMFGGELVA